MPEIALSADLQYDLHDTNMAGQASASMAQTAQKDDPKRTREIVSHIEEACGIQTIQQIVEKAERH